MRFTNKIKAEYAGLLSTMEYKESKLHYINRAAAKAMQHKKQYVEVENQTGVPWQWIAAVHMRESNADFRGVLHNGQKIIGKGRKTTIVPKGRGPFSSWSEAAIDAIKLKKLHLIKSWTPERMLYELERFNGWGYRYKGRSGRSPYLWGATNHQLKGKFVSDGKYSSRTLDKQLGAVPVMVRIQELDKPAKEIVKDSRRLTTLDRISKFIEWSGVGTLFSLGTIENIQAFLTDWKTLVILAFGFGVYLGIKWLKWQSIREYKEGRYIPSAQASNDNSQLDIEPTQPARSLAA